MNITVDPDIWQRCKHLSSKYHIVLSHVIEEFLDNYATQIEQMENLVVSGEFSMSEVRALLRQSIDDQMEASKNAVDVDIDIPDLKK